MNVLGSSNGLIPNALDRQIVEVSLVRYVSIHVGRKY